MHLHRPSDTPRAALALTHGAGSNCDAPLLIAIAEACAASGILVARYNLWYRQQRPTGPPLRSDKQDRESVRAAAAQLHALAPDVPLILGGHSYGGRQTSMAAAEDPALCDRLLLLSYPLHPPKQPEKLRTAHFPELRTPALFVHGTRDEFATIAELTQALTLIPAPTQLLEIPGAPHGLPPKIAPRIAATAEEWLLQSE